MFGNVCDEDGFYTTWVCVIEGEIIEGGTDKVMEQLYNMRLRTKNEKLSEICHRYFEIKGYRRILPSQNSFMQLNGFAKNQIKCLIQSLSEKRWLDKSQKFKELPYIRKLSERERKDYYKCEKLILYDCLFFLYIHLCYVMFFNQQMGHDLSRISEFSSEALKIAKETPTLTEDMIKVFQKLSKFDEVVHHTLQYLKMIDKKRNIMKALIYLSRCSSGSKRGDLFSKKSFEIFKELKQNSFTRLDNRTFEEGLMYINLSTSMKGFLYAFKAVYLLVSAEKTTFFFGSYINAPLILKIIAITLLNLKFFEESNIVFSKLERRTSKTIREAEKNKAHKHLKDFKRELCSIRYYIGCNYYRNRKVKEAYKYLYNAYRMDEKEKLDCLNTNMSFDWICLDYLGKCLLYDGKVGKARIIFQKSYKIGKKLNAHGIKRRYEDNLTRTVDNHRIMYDSMKEDQPIRLDFSKSDVLISLAVDMGIIESETVKIDRNKLSEEIQKIVFSKECLKNIMRNCLKQNKCIICNKRHVKLYKCIACMRVYYCGKEHQKEDWNRHKSYCKRK